ncbi:MAG: hypothetical protein ACD_64C00343G0005 [uncultured bacterium]|nr:MAG: hypothetical protein ACD_64C00343G0005 [uncultured bacterium]HLE76761.1 VTT domain-containing protein [Candidatus Babeliales bacterium]
MKTAYKKMIIGLILLFGIVFAVYYFGLAHYLSLENVKANAAYLQEKVDENYLYAVGMFIAISTALIAFTLPIMAPMGVMGGFLFGMWQGILYSMIAITIGASLSFLAVRYALSHVMKNRYGARLAGFNERMQKYGYSYLITLQLLTVVPYVVINSLAALAGVSFHMFLVTTIVGSLPVTAIYAFAGKQLYTINSWKDILSKEMLLVLFLLAGLALLPMAIRKLRHTDAKDDDAF